jgi:hypothetical protein
VQDEVGQGGRQIGQASGQSSGNEVDGGEEQVGGCAVDDAQSLNWAMIRKDRLHRRIGKWLLKIAHIFPDRQVP